MLETIEKVGEQPKMQLNDQWRREGPCEDVISRDLFFFVLFCFRAAPTLRNTVGARHSSLCGSYDNLKKKKKKGVGRSHGITFLLLPYVFIGKIKTVLNEWRRYSPTPYKKMVAHPCWIYSLVSPEGIFSSFYKYIYIWWKRGFFLFPPSSSRFSSFSSLSLTFLLLSPGDKRCVLHHLCDHTKEIQWFILQPINNDLNFCVSHWSTASQSSPLYIFFFFFGEYIFIISFLETCVWRLMILQFASGLWPVDPDFLNKTLFVAIYLKLCTNVIGFLFFIESRPNPRELAFFFAIWRGVTSSKYFYKETQRWREFRDKFTFKRWCHHGQHI